MKAKTKTKTYPEFPRSLRFDRSPDVVVAVHVEAEVPLREAWHELEAELDLDRFAPSSASSCQEVNA